MFIIFQEISLHWGISFVFTISIDTPLHTYLSGCVCTKFSKKKKFNLIPNNFPSIFSTREASLFHFTHFYNMDFKICALLYNPMPNFWNKRIYNFCRSFAQQGNYCTYQFYAIHTWITHECTCSWSDLGPTF